jgi:regulator of protease activity HflC (stomatin/prohibitin superfamily)
MGLIIYALLFFGVIILLSSFFTVKQQTAVVIERFGKFDKHSQLGFTA